MHCKPGQVEPAYIECGDGAAAMKVSQVNLFELGPVQISSLEEKGLFTFYSNLTKKKI